MTEKDREVVEWIARLGAAGAEHVMGRFGMCRSEAYRRLARLSGAGLLERHSLLYRQAGLYVATAQGLRWTGLERLGVQRVSVGAFAHAREVATVAVGLESALAGWRLLGERELRSVELDEGRLVGSARVGELPGGRAALHRPDLLLVSPHDRVVAVEVELSVKDRRRLARICRGWARARHVDAVYYLATPAPARAVVRAVEEVRAGERVRVLALAATSELVKSECKGAVHVGA